MLTPTARPFIFSIQAQDIFIFMQFAKCESFLSYASAKRMKYLFWRIRQRQHHLFFNIHQMRDHLFFMHPVGLRLFMFCIRRTQALLLSASSKHRTFLFTWLCQARGLWSSCNCQTGDILFSCIRRTWTSYFFVIKGKTFLFFMDSPTARPFIFSIQAQDIFIFMHFAKCESFLFCASAKREKYLFWRISQRQHHVRDLSILCMWQLCEIFILTHSSRATPYIFATSIRWETIDFSCIH